MGNQALRCYDYVNRPYADVCAEVIADPIGVLQRATVAGALAHAAQLHVRYGPLDIAAEIDLRVIATDEGTSPFNGPSMRLTLAWEAKRRPGLFPTMHATLTIYALTATETQLELEGCYAPPLGLIGKAIDATIGHRLADASVHRFVEQVATSLRAAR